MKIGFLSCFKWQLTAVVAAVSLHSPIAQAVSGAMVDSLSAKVGNRGAVSVIVSFKNSTQAGLSLSGLSAYSQQATIDSMQSDVVDAVAASGSYAEDVKTFDNKVPFMALTVDEAGLQALAQDPNVAAIQEDIAVPYTLDSAIPAMEIDGVHPYYDGGAAFTVAILDTGVRASHDWLSGRIVSEACFSSNNPSQGASSLCPNGQEEDTSAGSGTNCDVSIMEGCDHGTLVAGIAAGNPASGEKGTAYGANIIPIQVFSRFDDSGNVTPCSDQNQSSPCLLSYTSDQLAALSYLADVDNNLINTFNIVAANMSLGGGAHTGACDADARKPAIDSLRSQGVATVISAGNSSSTNSMGAPACISTAISVCGTDGYGNVYASSDVSALTDLCAVGSGVTTASAVNDSATGFVGGTSVAAPFVTGAIALMKDRRQRESIDDIEAALKNHAVLINDTRAGGTHTVRRLNVEDAVRSLGSNCNTFPIEDKQPGGYTSDAVPTFSWTGYSDCDRYILTVNDDAGAQLYTFNYSAAQTQCASDTSCERVYPNSLGDGDYTFTVQGVDSSTFQRTTKVPTDFTVGPPLVADCSYTPIAIGPNSTVSVPVPTFEWEGYANCSWYRIRVLDQAGSEISAVWHTAAASNCDADTDCEITPTGALANGSYAWQVQGYSAEIENYVSDFSAPMAFDVASVGGCTAAPDSLAPTGVTTLSRPTFNWEGMDACTWYQITVNKDDGSEMYKQWYQADHTSCDTDTSCEITPGPVLLNGNYTWTVQGWNEATSLSPLSDVMPLQVAAVGGCTAAPQPLTPTGSVNDPRPMLTWNGLDACTWYQLEVLDASGGIVLQKWYTDVQTACDTDTACEFQPPVLSNANYSWRVRGWSADTYTSAWSNATSFQVAATGGCLQAPVALAPNSAINGPRPTFTWDGYPSCTWYQIEVSDAGGAVVTKTWHESRHTECVADTSCEINTPKVNLTSGSYTWRIQGWNAETAHTEWTQPQAFSVN